MSSKYEFSIEKIIDLSLRGCLKNNKLIPFNENQDSGNLKTVSDQNSDAKYNGKKLRTRLFDVSFFLGRTVIRCLTSTLPSNPRNNRLNNHQRIFSIKPISGL